VGGDEFAILFDNVIADEIIALAHKVEKAIASHTFTFHNSKIKIQITVSIASNTTKPILENADLALKLIKNDLTNRVINYTDSLNLKKNVKENLKMIDTIKEAIQAKHVVPFFQPIVNLQTLKVEKYEALVRIKLENGTFLEPKHFLDTAKKTSFYQTITNIMIEETLKVAQKFEEFRFSINLSMIDILNTTITSNLFKQLEQNPLVASRIDIELVESEKITATHEVAEFIQKLRSLGVEVLIDDFGTGYSNFSYFSALDIDIIKIDGSIVSEILTDNKKMHMLKSIYKFSRGLGLRSVAEFVETKEIALELQELGVEYAQGYYFSKPLEQPIKGLTFEL
jgi:EAL domain-containing protein (putative c-di-GMP-specific phosphodiesterase class I)